MVLSFMSANSPHRRPTRPSPQGVDFIPQAILRKDINQVAKALDVTIEKGWDNLDTFEGVTFESAYEGVLVAIRHYAGHPDGTTTVYLPSEINDVGFITKIVAYIVEKLHFVADDVYWQRKDNPDL
jgi:hypothetical protein